MAGESGVAVHPDRCNTIGNGSGGVPGHRRPDVAGARIDERRVRIAAPVPSSDPGDRTVSLAEPHNRKLRSLIDALRWRAPPPRRR